MSKLLRQPSNIHGWVFTFNTYTNKWDATTRDNYSNLFSSRRENVLSSASIDTLMELIERTNGEPEKIEKLLA